MNISIFLMSGLFMSLMLLLWMFPYFNVSFYFLEWNLISLDYMLNFNNLLFAFILFLVSFSVFVFSTYYLNSELNFNYYYFVLLIFILSMFMLNFSSSPISMIISWDLLGISSFFLVLFYNNWDSCSGSMNTVLTNRLGDYFMFIFFSGALIGCFSMVDHSFFSGYLGFLLIATAATKSAQFPFSGWLPKAMSAPTPVSSLVHSSTLVTAGLILMMNFFDLVMHENMSKVILIVGIFTMFFSSITALVEEDLKKVVALSTLSQMGFATVTLGLGLYYISFLHLVSHALFKSCLFMQVGYIIHCSFGQQDGRGYSNNGNMPNFIQLQLLVTLFCLCGLIFSSGAVSKDFILEMFFSGGYMMFLSLMFFITIFLTFGYSYRLWKSLFLSFNKLVNHYSSSVFMNFLSLFLVMFSIFFMWWLNFNMLNIPALFLYVDFFSPLTYIFIMLFLSFLLVKLLFKELTYKFLVDYLAKNSILKMKNFKFIDNYLNSMIQLLSKNLSFFSLSSNYYMKSLNFNSVVFLTMMIFLLL
uniref:NADH dehydrogenase subunit 5 n=1 Tax=Cruznema tripartitum TaxID=53474 RepID=UPI0023D88128|nr:NADH dehydrogenase subunit 5 [Cruznema tripartitum]WCR50916.1 NADH dehydrogenase subunit 5 [Cruznema tripartitum]